MKMRGFFLFLEHLFSADSGLALSMLLTRREALSILDLYLILLEETIISSSLCSFLKILLSVFLNQVISITIYSPIVKCVTVEYYKIVFR